MDGDVSPMHDICDLADRYGAITYIDEVHAVGLYGTTGAGKLEELGLQDRVDIVNGTLGKAFGMQGGYIVSDEIVCDAVRSIASGFIFTTSHSPVMCAGALTSIKYVMDHNDLRIKHQAQSQKLKQHLLSLGFEIHPAASTHIVPVIVGDAVKCKAMSDALLNDYSIYVQPINFPTVEEGTERLRFTPTPLHTDNMINELVTALTQVFNEHS
jgi:5-aminolevulinate synthase